MMTSTRERWGRQGSLGSRIPQASIRSDPHHGGRRRQVTTRALRRTTYGSASFLRVCYTLPENLLWPSVPVAARTPSSDLAVLVMKPAQYREGYNFAPR